MQTTGISGGYDTVSFSASESYSSMYGTTSTSQSMTFQSGTVAQVGRPWQALLQSAAMSGPGWWTARPRQICPPGPALTHPCFATPQAAIGQLYDPSTVGMQLDTSFLNRLVAIRDALGSGKDATPDLSKLYDDYG